MKRIVILVVSILLALGVRAQQYQQLLSGGSFDSKSIPVGWKEEGDEKQKWAYIEGREKFDKDPDNHPVSADIRNTMPSAPKESRYFAYYFYMVQSTGGGYSTLITPMISYKGLSVKNPVLSFWWSASAYMGDWTSELKVLYRLGPRDEWKELRVFQRENGDNIQLDGVWSFEELSLPTKYNGNDISEIQLGFKATFVDGAAVLALDAIKVENRAEIPRTLERVSVWSTGNTCPSGTDVNPIAGVRLGIGGNSNELTLQDVQFNYTGTSLDDVSNFRLYYTRDSLFDSENCIATSATTISGNSIIFKGVNAVTNEFSRCFIWLCADVKAGVKHGNIISVSMPAGGVKAVSQKGGTFSLPLTPQTPSGECRVAESLFATGFEEGLPSKWKQSGESLITSQTATPDWMVGVPGGSGLNDPKYAYAGSKILATNLNGNYTNNIKHRVKTSKFGVSYYKDVKLHYQRILSLNHMDQALIIVPEIKNAAGIMGDTIYSNASSLMSDPKWTTTELPIERAYRNKDSISLEFQLFSVKNTNSPTPGGWNIDNFAITGDRIDIDAAVLSIGDFGNCGLSLAPTTIATTVRNNGYDNISNIKLGYSIDNGRTWTYKVFSGDLLKSARNNGNTPEERTYSFDPVQLTIGQKQIIVKAFVDGDEDESNDSQSTNLFVFPSLSGQEDYVANFATTSGNMYAGGTRSSWVYSTDTHLKQEKLTGWVTRPNGYYNNSESSYIESPCYDLTDFGSPVFTFTYAMDLHPSGGDKLTVKYSTDGGDNWLAVNSSTIYSKNWYGTWTKDHNNTAKAHLDTSYTLVDLNGVSNLHNVKFRICFESNASDTSGGVLIGSMSLTPIPYQIEARIKSPVSDCNIGVVPVTFTIENKGRRTLAAGLRIPTFIRIDGGTNFDTLVIPTSIDPGKSLDVSTIKRYDFNRKNDYTLGARILLEPSITGHIYIGRNKQGGGSDLNVSVLGATQFTLGNDIGTTAPDKITVTASVVNNNPEYTWYKYVYDKNDPTANPDTATWPKPWDSKWKKITGAASNKLNPGALNATEYGMIRVVAETQSLPQIDGNTCKYEDIVLVLNSNQDVAIDDNDITVSLSPSEYNSCFHDGEVEVSTQIQFVKGERFVVDTLPIGLDINGERVALEYVKLTSEWTSMQGENVTEKITYVFKKKLDLSARGEYNIKAYVLLASDIDRSNDSSAVIKIHTLGRPGAELNVGNELSISPASGHILIVNEHDIPSASTQFQWSMSVDGSSWTNIAGEDNQSFAIPDNRTMYYKVSVVDNACGASEDIVFVNTLDVSVVDIKYPSDTICYSDETDNIVVTVRNNSDDALKVGTLVIVKAELNNGTKLEQPVTLSEKIQGNSTLDVFLTAPVLFEMGEGIVEASVDMAGDVNSLNDRISKRLVVVPPPTVSMPIDTLIMGFTENTEYTIMPTTSLNVVSYQWNDENGKPVDDATGVSTNRDFKIKGLPLKKYVLTVSNGFCEASDSIVIISQDISIAILSPEDTCAWRMAGNVYPVKVQIINSGSDLEAGISVRLLGEADIDGAKTSLAHTVNFSEPFLSGEVKEVTMPQMLRLRGADFVQVSLTAFPEGFDDADESNNSALRSAFALGFPSVDFMPAPYTSILDNNITLNVVGRWMDYYWYLASDNLSKEDKWIGPAEKAIGRDSALVVGDTLKQATIAIYATNYGGCSGTRTQEVFFHTHDLAITQLIEPISACSMPDKSVVKVRVENVGDYTMNKLDTILLSVRVGTGEWIVDTMVIDSDDGFAPGQHIDFALGTSNPGVYSSLAQKAKTIDLSNPNDYTITTRVKTAYDRQPDNDEREDLVMHYQPINLSWPDRHNGCKGTEYTYDVEADASGLYANLGTPTYLWSTGARTAKVTLTEGSDIFQDKEVEYTVNIVNGVGCSRSTSFKITYLALPEASIIDVNGDPMNGSVDICAGDQLYIGSGSAHEYLWNTGATTANIFATESGSYIVTVKNASGCTNSDSVRVVKHELPYIHMGEVTALCDGNALPLDAGDAAEYVWILPSGAPVYERNVVATEAGMYIANIKDHFGCQNADTVNLEVIPSPTDVKILNATDLTECPGVEVYLNVTSKGGTRYKWSTGEVSQNINVKSDTDQSYTVTVGNDHGCTQSASINVKRYPAEKVRIETVCKDNDKYGLKVYNVANKYEWSGMSQTGAEIEAEKGRTYSVTITDGNNCKHTGSAMVQNPSVSISLGAPLCEGASTQLNSSITDAKSYTWTGVEASGATATISNGGTYGLSVVTRDNCTSTPASITVDVRPAPKPTISVSGGQMTVGGGTFSSVVWNTGETTPSIRVSKVGTYTVTVTNADGCKAEASSTYTWLAPVVESLEANVVAYPNPTSNQLNVRIEASQAAAYTLTLYSSIGEAVWTRIVQVDAIHEEVIDVQHLPAGFYLLRVSEGQRATVLKIAVE